MFKFKYRVKSIKTLTKVVGLTCLFSDKKIACLGEKEREFSLEEVRRNDGTNGKPKWVTYRGGVHDVSSFEHPGGKFIDQALGGDVAPFWAFWAYHLRSKKVAIYLFILTFH